MGLHRVGHDWSDLACAHALEKEMATHSSILAWRIPGMEEPGGLPSMGSHRVGHDWSDLAAAAAARLTFDTSNNLFHPFPHFFLLSSKNKAVQNGDFRVIRPLLSSTKYWWYYFLLGTVSWSLLSFRTQLGMRRNLASRLHWFGSFPLCC